jgi:hypothetical protein
MIVASKSQNGSKLKIKNVYVIEHIQRNHIICFGGSKLF